MGNETEFHSTRYEYTTREVPTETEAISSSADQGMEAEGWHRAWADITSEGTFIVYRRERNPAHRRVRRTV